MQFHLPWREPLWVTPGGGLEEGEDAADAVVRELYEETGLRIDAAGQPIWNRALEFRWKEQIILQHETYFWVRTERFEPEAVAMQAGDEIDYFLGYRWWPISTLPDRDDDFAPKTIGGLIRTLLRDGAPEAPHEIPV